MNTEELEAFEAQLREWKPRPPSERVFQQVFPHRQEDDRAPQMGWLAWFGPAVAAVAMLCAAPIFLAQSDHTPSEGNTNIACLATGQLTGEVLQGFGAAPAVNIWHNATLATTNR